LEGKNQIVTPGVDWRPDRHEGYRLRMATVIPISDRRARLAFLLAALGIPSFGITVPAAIWLGVSSVRQRRLSSGGEPALGFIALVLAGLDVMMLNSVLLRSFDIIGTQRVLIGSGWALALATAAAICTASTLRIHPERWGALLVARAGLIGAMAGGTALLVRLIAVID
jgi:hypothetical protein